LWEKGVRAWIEKKQKEDPNFSVETPPTETDNVHRLENRPVFSVWGLASGDTMTQALPNISIQATAPRGINRSEYYFNDRLFASNFNYPFGLNRAINVLPSGSYQLKIRVCDDVDNCSEQTFNVTLAVPGAVSDLDYNLSWLTPADKTSVSSSSFPLELSVNVFNAEAVADLSFYYQATGGEVKLIDKKRLVRSQNVSTWIASPASWIAGSYQLWAEAYDWPGNKRETEKIKVDFK
jgi:hypothetical protein